MTSPSDSAAAPRSWRDNPASLLILLGAVAALSFSSWRALLNNFAIEHADFTGAEIGTLQSLREVPGFLAFTAIFLLRVVREQRLALVSVALLGIGTAIAGWFPTVVGLYCTTVLMSVGFHYGETMQQSLALQWLAKDRAPIVLGRVIAAASGASLVAYALIWVAFELLETSFSLVYLVSGGTTVVLVVVAALVFPTFPQKVAQHKRLVLRRRYWLYYSLTFLAGARRQIFTVFAGFMMVEKFGYSVADITLLFLVNYAANIWLAPAIGKVIARFGERTSLTFEYAGLVLVFLCYSVVEDSRLAAGLYVVDHLFFALAIAIKTYFQKISSPADVAPTAAVSFTINHIAAVLLPVALGYLWLVHPSAVFYVGAGLAVVSLALSQLVPRHPELGNETVLGPAPS
ncbi:MAG: MFS transporter [Myxococcota bacterium]